jgi:hypothetical protein
MTGHDLSILAYQTQANDCSGRMSGIEINDAKAVQAASIAKQTAVYCVTVVSCQIQSVDTAQYTHSCNWKSQV